MNYVVTFFCCGVYKLLHKSVYKARMYLILSSWKQTDVIKFIYYTIINIIV